MKLSRWLLLLTATLAVPAARADLISTMPNWNGNTSISPFGQPDTATYGQTITVGNDRVLSSFTFHVNTSPDFPLGPTYFSAYVMQWDDSQNLAFGPILYQSPVMMNPNDGVFHAITVNPNIALDSGSQYVLFFNVSNEYDGQDDFASFGATDDYADVYTGGKFVFSNNGNDFGALTTTPWFDGTIFNGEAWDLAFTAQLVPAPSGIILAVVGGAGLFLLRRKKGLRVA